MVFGKVDSAATMRIVVPPWKEERLHAAIVNNSKVIGWNLRVKEGREAEKERERLKGVSMKKLR